MAVHAKDRLIFKLATEPDEIAQIRRLNYGTFVEAFITGTRRALIAPHDRTIGSKIIS